jgi:hypothetical protein
MWKLVVVVLLVVYILVLIEFFARAFARNE